MGFAKDGSQKTERALKDFFTPEFRNRLSATIPFAPLSPEALETIVGIEIGRLNELLAPKNITVKLTKAARAYLAQEGYDERYGARHIARVIDEQVKEPLTDAILFGELKYGGRVKVGYKEGAPTFAFTPGETTP
jgi:ATP-dependent Clp protease ATP-binding subunit ClpA